MTKRITIQSGDYVLLSDIPNEQVFNLVKECFVNAGFASESLWMSHSCWDTFHAWSSERSCFSGVLHRLNKRQLSLSDVFNSTNGMFDWNRNTTHVGKFNTSRIKWVYTVVGAEMITLEKIFDYEEKPNTYKISKCFDIDDLRYTDISSVQGRALGKSTAHHLELISKAMKSPEQWVEIMSDYDNLERHNRWAFEEVRNLCHKLGLDWMEFSVSGNSIRYMPYQTVKMVTKWEVIA